jgi:hypothetical protein
VKYQLSLSLLDMNTLALNELLAETSNPEIVKQTIARASMISELVK